MRPAAAVLLAGVFLLQGAPGASAEEAAVRPGGAEGLVPVGPEESLVPPAPPGERPEEPPAMRHLWKIRPGIGASTMRLGGLEHFADPTIDRITGNWFQIYGIRPGATERKNINFAVIESVEASFQVDPLVCVTGRVASLRSERGSLVTVSQAGATRLEDSWEFSTDMILVTAGAGFNLPLSAKTTLNLSLHLGVGFATVRISHRYHGNLPGVDSVEEASAEGEATAFVPEFAMEIERDLSESLAAGVGLGYRFGGIESFRSRYANSLNLWSPSPEIQSGSPIRNATRALLTSDYGGLILVVFLTARG